jgi:hypothetical protein
MGAGYLPPPTHLIAVKDPFILWKSVDKDVAKEARAVIDQIEEIKAQGGKLKGVAVSC